MTIFDKIIKKEIPAKIVYEDDLCLAFHDINPQAPIHVLLIPKRRIPTMNDVQASDAETLGHLMVKAPEIATKLGVAESGYRLVVNTNEDAGQSVHHIHLHLIGGRAMAWPPG